MSDFMQGNADNAVQVPFSDDESEKKVAELIDDDSPTASPEERLNRKQKRQERITRLLNDGKENAEKVRSLEAEQSSLKVELAELRGRLSSQQQSAPQPQGDGKDELTRRLDAVYERQASAYTAAQAEIKAGTFTEERSRYYERVAREIESDKGVIHAERVQQAREPARQREQAQQIWVQKYPEVYGNTNAYQYAEATFQRRRALGENVTNALVDEVMTEAMATFKLGPKRGPSTSDKQRMSGIASSGNGGGGRSDGGGIEMTPHLRRMAIAANPDLSEADAVKKWANGPGKRLREKKVL